MPDPETAAAHRLLGSPTIRVNGSDVEPGANERSEFGLESTLAQAAVVPSARKARRL